MLPRAQRDALFGNHPERCQELFPYLSISRQAQKKNVAQVSLQRSIAQYPGSAQQLNIPAVLNQQVSLQCPTAEYPCSAQPQSIPAVINSNLQRPTAKYPSNPTVSLQCPWQRQRTLQCPTHSISAVLSGKVSLSCPALDTLIPTACAPAVPNCNILAVRLQCFKEDSLGGQGNITFIVQLWL